MYYSNLFYNIKKGSGKTYTMLGPECVTETILSGGIDNVPEEI